MINNNRKEISGYLEWKKKHGSSREITKKREYTIIILVVMVLEVYVDATT